MVTKKKISLNELRTIVKQIIKEEKNKLAREFVKLEKSGASIEELEAFGTGALQKAAREGDVAGGALMAGQIAGMVKERESAKAIIESVYNEAVEVIKKVSKNL